MERQAYGENCSEPEQKPTCRNLRGNQSWSGEPQRLLVTCWRLVHQIPELKTPGGPSNKEASRLFWVLPLGPLPGFHSKYQRKNPACFWQGERKRNCFEMCQSILLLNKAALFYQSLICRDFICTQPVWEKGNSQPLVTILSHLGEESLQEYWWNSRPTGVGLLEDRELVTVMALQSHLNITTLKTCYWPQFFKQWHHVPLSTKNLHGTLKSQKRKKKQSWKRLNKDQHQSQIRQGCSSMSSYYSWRR